MPRSEDFITGTGIGVSDLEQSAQFYERALGMTRTRNFQLPHMDEIVLNHAGRNAVILMHWTDGSARTYRDLPIKLVFYVTDPKAVSAKIAEAGGSVTTPATANASMGGALIAMCKDLDGYVVELIQAPKAATA